MARYLGSKWKRARRERYSLYDKDDWKRRPTLPGQHPVSVGRLSSYAVRFREKQKLKRIFGMMEKQFVRFFKIASKSKENTGVVFMQLLEMRLDNVVYRLGLAETRDAARQLVSHGHITVNSKKVNIPSFIVSVGDEISLSKRILAKESTKFLLEAFKKAKTPKWLSKLSYGGKVTMIPTREMMDQGINEQLIVEFYSK